MRLSAVLFVLPLAHAFSSSFTPANRVAGPSNANTVTMEYIPAGMSKEQWRKIKEEERNKNKGKNLGVTGITTFKSRSFADWQKSGGKNLFPVNPKTVKDPREIPYMQRPGGKPDNSDLKKTSPFGMFNFGGKKKEEEPEQPKAPPARNWWTLK